MSGYLKENLPANLSKNFTKKSINLNSTNAFDPSFQGLIKETFITTNNQMTLDLRVDTNFSGSTCVSLIYTPTKLTTINVGDSRAVLGRLINGGNFSLNSLENRLLNLAYLEILNSFYAAFNYLN